MKRRQYAIIVEENCLQQVWEFNDIDDAVDTINSNTYGYLWHEEDCMPAECIETNNYIGLRQYLLFLNKEEKHKAVNIYCDTLERLNRVKHINQLRRVVPMFNSFLAQIGSDTRIYLNSRKIYPVEPFGPCGF